MGAVLYLKWQISHPSTSEAERVSGSRAAETRWSYCSHLHSAPRNQAKQRRGREGNAEETNVEQGQVKERGRVNPAPCTGQTGSRGFLIQL